MAYKLSNLEKETIITFNEAESIANITTYNSSLIRKLDGLCSSRPNELKCTESNNFGGKFYTVPKKWIKVNASRILNEEAKQKLSDKMKSKRAEQLNINSDVQI